MLLRRLVAAVCPLIYCVLVLFAFQWLDAQPWLPVFWGYAVKGLLLGVALAIIMPTGGVKSRMNGLQPWLLGGAGLLLVLILLQYLSYEAVLTLPEVLLSDPQTLLAEGAAVGFILVTVFHNRRR